jgi:hypothetical protein
MKKVSPGKTYVGIVEDITDPNKEGRVKARVLDIFDDLKKEDIPWANPWKDLSGGQFGVPEIGKVVIVVFEQGDVYKPEYICTEHWNVNLETKLKSLSDSDYQSMRSVIFDHKTQIYANDGEGLKLDHKFNNINIKETGININLKDNNMMVNIGDSTANQQMILGNNFFDWFDTFVEALLQNTAFLGNSGAPVLSAPSFLKLLTDYQAKRDEKFLSHHVNVVDNNKVSTVKNDKREETAQAGDTWQSTKAENTLTTTSAETNKPVDGEKPLYDETFSGPPTDTVGASVEDPVVPEPVPALPDKSSIKSNKEIEKLVWFLKSKNYKVFENNNELNIVALRNESKMKGDVTNKFDDSLHVFYKNSNGNWELCEYQITTVPGLKPGTGVNGIPAVLPDNVPMLRLGQYVEQLSFGKFAGDPLHPCLIFESCAMHFNTENDFYDWESPTKIGPFPVSIHMAGKPPWRYPNVEKVYMYSKGSQTFKNKNQYDQFLKLCEDQVKLTDKKKFTYTLCSKIEFNEYESPDDQRSKISNLTGAAGGITGAATGAAGGITGAATGAAGGITGAATGAAGGITGAANGGIPGSASGIQSNPDYIIKWFTSFKKSGWNTNGGLNLDQWIEKVKSGGLLFDTEIVARSGGTSLEDANTRLSMIMEELVENEEVKKEKFMNSSNQENGIRIFKENTQDEKELRNILSAYEVFPDLTVPISKAVEVKFISFLN